MTIETSIPSGRARTRKPDSARRAPLPGGLPKAFKRERARLEARAPTAHIRVFGVALDADDRTYIRRKLGMKLGKFGRHVERVTVRVQDVNGPRGGVDYECRVKVVLTGRPSVVLVVRDSSVAAAIDRALGGAERAVRRAVQRRRITASNGRRAARLPKLPSP